MNEENENNEIEVNEVTEEKQQTFFEDDFIEKKEESFVVKEEVKKPKLTETKPKPTYTQH